MFLFMLMVPPVVSSVHLQHRVLNLASKSPASKALMRKHYPEPTNDRSGHKYGLVYPGVGWIVWRDEKELPEYLKFELHYLGGNPIYD